MLIIKVKNKNIESALKSYKYKVYKTKQLEKIREQQEYIKDSVNKEKKKRKQYIMIKKEGTLNESLFLFF